MKFEITNNFTNNLVGDKELSNTRRQVENASYSIVKPTPCSDPSLMSYSNDVVEMLGLTSEDVASEEFLKIFSGNKNIDGANPYAMCYGGHQFGNWAGQLGDGRAINIADIKVNNNQYTLQLKGAGPTPYSRTADGLAVLRSSVREYLCSEAMYHLGVPTTRALCLIKTGDEVLRDVMYNGNAAYEQGAIVTRVAPSFIRFGNFEIFASRQDISSLKALTDYTIQNHFPQYNSCTKNDYILFIKEVAIKTIDMVVEWQRVGFVHGVMNTDNMSILGLTIDYGPYGWLENFDLQWTPNTTDAQYHRYAYGNQPNIAIWNILKLMNALYPLIEDAVPLQEILDEIKIYFSKKYTAMMAAKLGIEKVDEEARQCIQALIKLLQKQEIDYTIFFRNISNLEKNEIVEILPDFMNTAFYENDFDAKPFIEWMKKYQTILHNETDTDEQRKVKMDLVNPKYVLRNYMAHQAIELAENGDYSLIKQFEKILKHPYDEQSENEQWFTKRPDWAKEKIGCSMLSCSS